MWKFLLAFAVLWGLASRHRPVHAISKHPVVCVIAFDGFRPDYIERNSTPTLRRVREHGVRTEFLKNVFPTKTFVNFFSMATGMYAHKHGVLGNTAFTTDGQCVGNSYELFHYNPDITPIWTLNEMSGDGRHSGVMMWVGEQYEYRNVTTTFYQEYNESMPWHDRVDKVVGWVTHEQTPANLVYMYFEQPDSASHKDGVKSKAVTEQLKRIETILDYFFHELAERDVLEKTNVIILSDHGMVDVNLDQKIDLKKILDPKSYRMCGGSPVLQIQLAKGYEDEAYKNLTQVQNELKNFQVYKKDEIPQRWHYKGTKRVTDLLLVADLPYVFGDEKDRADHGYDNAEPDMHAFFTAIGPLFKENYSIKSLQNIDLYALMAYIMQMDTSKLKVKPDAQLTSIAKVLKTDVWDSFKNRDTQKILKYFVPEYRRKLRRHN